MPRKVPVKNNETRLLRLLAGKEKNLKLARHCSGGKTVTVFSGWKVCH